MQYHAAFASPRPEAVADLFRWHMFVWTLGFLAAVSYSDLAVDLDKLHDDANYRTSIGSAIAREIDGVPADFSDIRKFERYYEFESLDVNAVCDQVMSVIRGALADGRMEAALGTLAQQPPLLPAAAAVELLLGKIRNSLSDMAASRNRTSMSNEEWKDIAGKSQRIWFRPVFRHLGRVIHSLAFPLVRAARMRGIRI
jgi:hypothetical protein